MNDTSRKTIDNEKPEIQEMVELVKQLSPKEKERILYMIQGVALISEAVREQTGKVGA